MSIIVTGTGLGKSRWKGDDEGGFNRSINQAQHALRCRQSVTRVSAAGELVALCNNFSKNLTFKK